MSWVDLMIFARYACCWLQVAFMVGFSLALVLVLWNLLCTAASFKRAFLAAAKQQQLQLQLAQAGWGRAGTAIRAGAQPWEGGWQARGLEGTLATWQLPEGAEAVTPEYRTPEQYMGAQAAASHQLRSPVPAGAATAAAATPMQADPLVWMAGAGQVKGAPAFVPPGHTALLLGVLASSAVLQLYIVGLALTLAGGILCHPWFYAWFLPTCYPYLGKEERKNERKNPARRHKFRKGKVRR